MYVFGNGDGGGGPLASMLERLRRMKDLVNYFIITYHLEWTTKN